MSLYEVKIDFDEASLAWRANKVNVGMSKSMFKYCCGMPKKDGTPCKAPPYHWCRSLRPKGEKFIRTWGPCKKHK